MTDGEKELVRMLVAYTTRRYRPDISVATLLFYKGKIVEIEKELGLND